MGACDLDDRKMIKGRAWPASDDQKGPAKRTGLIPVVDRRLEAWGRWQLENAGSGRLQANCGSVLGALIAGGGVVIKGTNPSEGSMPDDIFDTDQAVSKLPDKLRMAVEVQYLDQISTKQQKASKCGCTYKTLYNRLAQAHEKILFTLRSTCDGA